MKRLVMAAMAAMLSGTLYASCMGPFCWDDTGASIGGLSYDGNGSTLPSLSSTTIAGLTPKAVGQTVYCNSCTGNNVPGKVICYSTATVVGSFVMNVSSTPVCK